MPFSRFVPLAAAAHRFAETGESKDWLQLAYPLAQKAVEHWCSSMEADADDVLSAFLEERLLHLGFVLKVARSDEPQAYLRKAAYHFVCDELRRVGPAFVRGVEFERFLLEDDDAPSEYGDDAPPSGDEETGAGSVERALAAIDSGEEASLRGWATRADVDPSCDDRHVEPARQERDRLGWLAGLPMRDRVLLLAQFAGLAVLGEPELRWIAERRGVTLEALREEVAVEVARVDAMKAECREQLAGLEDRIASREGRLRKAWREFQLERRIKHAEEVERLSSLLDDDTRRARGLRERLADPFCSRPDRVMIAWFLGETRDERELARATNTAWTRARRLRDRLLTT